MNKQRRNEVQTALRHILEAIEILADCGEQEGDAFTALPDNLQQSSKGEKMMAVIDTIDEAIEELHDQVENIAEACDIGI